MIDKNDNKKNIKKKYFPQKKPAYFFKTNIRLYETASGFLYFDKSYITKPMENKREVINGT